MTLYNITFREDMREVLTPNIPYSAADGENKIINRVCFSDSIEHCVEAIGPCSRDMHNGAIFTIRSVDTDKMNSKSIITPKELFDKGFVPDALETQEYWYLEQVQIKLSKAKVISYSFEYALAWTCIKMKDMQEIVNNLGVTGVIADSSKQLYDKVNCYFIEHKMYDKADALFDYAAELPFAQTLKIRDLKLEVYT